MGWKRVLSIGVGLAASAASMSVAQDSSPEGQDSPPEKKFRFGIYVEAAGGDMELTPLDASIDTTTFDISEGLFRIDSNGFGRAAIGWQLNPAEKGRFALVYNGYEEDGYAFEAQGMQARADGTLFLVTAPVVWWTVNADPSGTQSVRTVPSWNPADDANQNNLPDPDEVRYLEDPADRLVVQSPAPNNLQNRLQTYDGIYQREFGGRKTRAAWTAGIRYYIYEGNIPAGAWLNADAAGVGYTDGGVLRLITFNQEATGVGPTFSLELQQRFWRDRFQIYGNAHAAFVFANLEADSGRFFTLVRDTTSSLFVPVPASLQRSTSKTTWQPGVEIGIRVQAVEGLFFYASWNLNSYQDVLLTPTSIIIPESAGQAPQGVDGVYNSQDLEYEGGAFGITYQF